ncbi:hypothetical protein JCM8208_000780 [Rhodotorula glutinis]
MSLSNEPAPPFAPKLELPWHSLPPLPDLVPQAVVVVKQDEPTVDRDKLELQDWIEARGERPSTAEKGKWRCEVEPNEDKKPAFVTPTTSEILDGVPFPTPALTPRFAVDDTPYHAPPSPGARAPRPSSTSHVPPSCASAPLSPTAAPVAPPAELASPSRQPSRPVAPLDRLLPIGTIVLHQHRLVADVLHELAEDGWLNLAKDTLEPIPDSAADADPPVEQAPVPPRPVAPRKSSSAKAGSSSSRSKKRRASTTAGPSSSSKKVKYSAHPHLDALLTLSAAHVLRATVRIVGEGEQAAALVRVYLVPQDLPELRGPGAVRSRTRPPGSVVLGLLSAVRVHAGEWDGEMQDGDLEGFMAEIDGRSLLEVYRDITSPSADASFVDSLVAPDDVKQRLSCALDHKPAGVQSDLFPYQHATLAKMLARELAPQDIPSPSFLRRSTRVVGLGGSWPDGRKEEAFFVSLDGGVRLEPLTVREPKGGILAEDMGVGKTVIVLALVMSTLSELPKLEGTSTFLDGSPSAPPLALLTDVSVDFPFPFEMDDAKKLKQRVTAPLVGVDLDNRELLERQAALARQAAEDADVPHLPFPSLRSLMVHKVKTSPLACRYPHFDEIDGEHPLPQPLFDLLQKTPPFYRLFPSSTQREARRRDDSKPVKIVVAPTTLIIVPTELVRQWAGEIDKHVEPKALRALVLRTSKDKFRSVDEMATYDVILMSVARFSDAAEAGDMSLRGVHWRRIVIDEGHVLAHANLTRKLAEELRAESRWAVSGTPSTNLRGGETGETSALFASNSATGGDRTDLDRLGNLFARFVKHPAFARPDSLRKLVQSHVLGGGERAGRLETVFNRAIIRHNSDVVSSYIQLPPMETSIVEIEMEEAERLVYNTLVGFFVSNSITSQRVDVDHLFHKSKRAELDVLCSNLATATTFFGSSEYYQHLVEARKFGEESLVTNRSATWTDDERLKQRKVVDVFQEALDDPEVALTAATPAVAMEVANLDDELVRTFVGLGSTRNPRGRALVSQNELVRLRVDLKELQREDVKAWDDDEDLVEELITFEEKRKRVDARPKNFEADPDEEPLFKKRSKKDTTPLVPLPDDSVFRRVQLVRTTSSKINFIVSELRKHPSEKFIIFSSSNVDLLFSNLSETLDLVGISHTIFASGHARNGDRGAIAQRFNQTSATECQAILVDAKLGGRGITLTAATRMIFLEPVWKPDLEVQASKRAHRLGQTKPVFLQILVVKTTFEEALLQRRKELKSEEFDKRIKAPQQDQQLRNRLQQAQYLEPSAAVRDGARAVSPAFDPPVMLIRGDASDEGALVRATG